MKILQIPTATLEEGLSTVQQQSGDMTSIVVYLLFPLGLITGGFYSSLVLETSNARTSALHLLCTDHSSVGLNTKM